MRLCGPRRNAGPRVSSGGRIEPVLPGGGTRLFADIGRDQITLERTRLIEGPASTHLRFRR
jgi:hypothetical protein